MTDDLIQRVREAVIAVLDRNPRIASLTGRPSKNVVPWGTGAFGVTPVIAYFVVVGTETAGDGDTRRIMLQLTAVAADEATVNALLFVVEQVLNAKAFAVLAQPLDAVAIGRSRRSTPFDSAEDVYRGDLDLTLRVTQPVPVLL